MSNESKSLFKCIYMQIGKKRKNLSHLLVSKPPHHGKVGAHRGGPLPPISTCDTTHKLRKCCLTSQFLWDGVSPALPPMTRNSSDRGGFTKGIYPAPMTSEVLPIRPDSKDLYRFCEGNHYREPANPLTESRHHHQ